MTAIHQNDNPLQHISDSGLYKSFFENPDAVYVLDLQGNYVDANQACLDIFGYTREELLNMSFVDIAVPEKLEPWLRCIVKGWAEGKSQTFETTVYHKDGHRVELNITDTPIINENRVVGVFCIAKDITEHKRTDMLLQSVFKHAKDAFIVLDYQGYVVAWNHGAESIFGYSARERVGEKLSLIIPERFRDAHHRGLERYVSTGEKRMIEQTVETVGVHKDGQEIPMELSISTFGEGQQTYFIGIIREITERKHHEQLLRQGRERYESLKRYNPNGICSFDLEWNVMGANPAYERITGYTLDELKQLNVWETLVFEEDVEWKRKAYAHHFLENIETAFRHKDGHRIDVRVTTVPIIVDGKNIGVYTILEDVTQRKITQQQLELSVERYQRLVDNSLDAIVIIQDGKWDFMNSAALQMFGATHEDEIIGRNYIDFLHPDHHEDTNARLATILSDQPVAIVEFKWKKLNGEVFHAELRGTKFNDTAVQVVIRDISDRKQSEETIRQSEKLSAVGQLAAGIAHEIRNPLTALKGFTQLLHAKSSGADRHYFEIMRGEMNRVEGIVDELLVLAKPQTTNFQPHYVQLILQEVITLLSPQALLKNVLIHVDFEVNAPKIFCEESQLKQVFVNVIKNGIEAMPMGGNMFIQLKSDNGKLFIEFTDEGKGVPQDLLPKLGKPFYTTKDRGTGLGLMVSYNIIRNHRGTIAFSSEVGKGTTVSITLPL
ncbi:PAS domain S-box protein [Alicyclobacillus fastidiosus]|uniref:histidine kinase n=1 Tax=Alicyclobacillus fastidiosus TaxID=392011 RepID=A0ABV5ALG8_9BACL|nr:PAS domain S-box protein [Alicyclobacillus fastidiosus]WEH08396.1 PAS domain S-box protein [Alicyclobacillus fastidiosus]